KDKIYKEIKYLLSDFLNNNFKELIKKEIISEITKKYLRTKQYKEIREQFSIESDKIIKSGLKDVISEIVKSEINKCFK
ncbi:MAG: hypothetical protein LIR50_04795, partial [Bacillota bacterium]|nr:hypothetical protein [Bacillota bacterium]